MLRDKSRFSSLVRLVFFYTKIMLAIMPGSTICLISRYKGVKLLWKLFGVFTQNVLISEIHIFYLIPEELYSSDLIACWEPRLVFLRLLG